MLPSSSCRLVTPTKTDVGRARKQILDRINKDLRNKLQVNQWTSTRDVLNWFDNLIGKDELSFLIFNIEEFYPSISEKLLKDIL